MYILLALFLLRALTNTITDLPCGASGYRLLPWTPAWCLTYRVQVSQLVRKPTCWARGLQVWGTSRRKKCIPKYRYIYHQVKSGGVPLHLLF